MSKIICEKEELTAVADAIRAKTDTTAPMSLGEMATNVMNISGGSSQAIIDVTQLPNTDINEGVFYRLLKAEFWYGGFKEAYSNMRCYTVDGLPTVGEACIDLSTGVPAGVKAYYNTQDGEVYGYVDAAVSAGMSVPTGWYPASTLMTALGKTYGGVITSTTDMTDAEAYYVLLSSIIYHHKDGIWYSLDNGIKTMTFKTIEEAAKAIVQNGYQPFKMFMCGTLKIYTAENTFFNWQGNWIQQIDAVGLGNIGLFEITGHHVDSQFYAKYYVSDDKLNFVGATHDGQDVTLDWSRIPSIMLYYF